MKVVKGWMMDGQRPSTPDWDGSGRHPILGMTMEEIKMHAKASAANYTPPANNPDKTPAMSAEQEANHMAIRAQEMQKEHLEALASNLKS